MLNHTPRAFSRQTKTTHYVPLSMRKANLARLLDRRPEGIFASNFEHIARG